MGKVRDAVIDAAGLGTRMLPTSAYIPKELLPLVDVPVLHHLIFEAKSMGAIESISSLHQRKISRHFKKI